MHKTPYNDHPKTPSASNSYICEGPTPLMTCLQKGPYPKASLFVPNSPVFTEHLDPMQQD